MNASEFSRWWTDAKTCWPSLDVWIVKHFPDQSQQRECLRKWAGVLADVRLDIALEVNRLMQTGDLPFVGKDGDVYDADKERLPQHVRRLGRQLAFDRSERPESEPVDLGPNSFPAGKILQRITELRASGFSDDDAKTAAIKEFPIGTSRYEPRYRCLLCLDSGYVTVAPPWAIRAMLEDRFEQCCHRNGTVLCKCHGPLPSDSRFKIATYDAALCFKVEQPLWPPSEVERFREWCNAKREEFVANRASDQSSQREFV